MEQEHQLEQLAARASAWRQLPDDARAGLLRACLARVAQAAPGWVAAACARKGLDPRGPLSGEEWMASVAVSARALRLSAEVLEGHHPLGSLRSYLPEPLDDHPARRRVEVFPLRYADRWILPRTRVELELEDHAPPSAQVRCAAPGGLALVLGAGNVDSILIHDLLDQLLRHNRVVLLKLSPVSASSRPALEEVLRPLIEAGFLAITEGKADRGSALAADPRVDHVHLTGSEASFMAMVWGSDSEERRRRLAADEPRLRASLSAELGAVTPILVVPGAWSRIDLKAQARHIAAMAAHNASHNCNAAQLLVTARDWPQRPAFLDEVRAALAALPARPSWYPGAAERWHRFRKHYPNAEELGPVSATETRWLFASGVPLRRQELACQEEAFGPFLAEASVIAKTPAEFLARAVAPLNEEVAGTLSCAVLAPPPTPELALQRALAELAYGNICVNTWPGLAFALGVASWGAFPGQTRRDPGSGLGQVHNLLLLDRVRRSLVFAPFRAPRRPAFDPGHRQLRGLGQALAAYEQRPSLGRLLRLGWRAWG